MAGRKALALSLLLALFVVAATAGNIEFVEKELGDNETLRLKVAIVTVEDAWVGDNAPFLEINQSFTQETPQPAKIDVLMYYSGRADSIGYVNEDGAITHCCTAELVLEQVCSEVGTPIILDDEHVVANEVVFTGVAGEEPTLRLKNEGFTVSGIYYIKYYNCPDTAGTVIINGDVSWINPFGHLSADLYPYLWFFGLMTLLYLVLGAIWMVLSALHWKELLMLQNCVAAVIFLGMVECVTWYFDFITYNYSGNFNWGAIVVGVLTSTLKRTVSRLLVLVVAMGYGVVKANLGTNTYKVLFLGMMYFAVSGLQQLILTYLREGDNIFLSFIATIIIFPAALLDTAFYWWIFLSLMRTIQQLKLRKQEIKLAMYQQFFVVLAIGAVLTSLVIVYQTLLVMTSSEDAMWRTWWMFQAFWHLLYFMILVAIAFIWRPVTNNTRYAYREADDIELEIIQVKKGGPIELGEEITLDFDISGILDGDEEMVDEVSKME